MRSVYYLSMGLVLTTFAPLWAAPNAAMSGSNLGSVTGGHFQQAWTIIEKRCTACHSSSVVNAALASHKDMATIEKEMEKKGARLSSNEREVLGIYWKQQPLKK